MNKNSLLKNILLFLIVFLALNFILKGCQSSEEQTSVLDQGDIGFMTDDTSYSRNKDVTVEIKNNTAKDLIITQDCPAEPFDVFHYNNGEWVQITSQPELDCSKAESYTLKPGEEAKVPYDNWKHALFSRMGRFKISFTTEEKTFTTNEFIVEEEGILTKLWNGVLYRPIYNTLIFLISILPGNDLGLALILLTIIIRTILLAPSHKAMKAQRKMQEIQPKIEEIKQKYKGDQQKIAQETMLIWKTQKVNPLGSCLPLLLQFPILIALFWVVKGGLNPDNTYLLYTTYGDFSFSNITTVFLGLDLLKINLYVLPLIIGLLQFGQMKLAMYQKGKKKGGSSAAGGAGGGPKEMAMASNIMMYAMPVLIAIFTAQLPAAVGVYWGVSTLYGIIQQIFVNRSFDKPGKKSDAEEVTVRVIENKT